ncbi:hypothetical protein EVB55_147 [Rhizobium phage RHph_Y68]|uniref:Uncharacterized protein n=1 Tax=Rhizobium phage RHph_Y68 TaxID=2509787 RepID=A0A7S5QY49_9CAUD|nr:hypothetical protein PP934_gp147 [Rhizobium phage RHph_Y68]QIG68082.1 hypothetical protein EVB55_147 [Rhizobium phage RHph_Y68]
MKALLVAFIGIVIGIAAVYGKDFGWLASIAIVMLSSTIAQLVWFTYHCLLDEDNRWIVYGQNEKI